jgi:hypothetical protein
VLSLTQSGSDPKLTVTVPLSGPTAPDRSPTRSLADAGNLCWPAVDTSYIKQMPRIKSHCSCLSCSDDTPFNFNLSRFTHGLQKLVLLPHSYSDGRRVIQCHSWERYRLPPLLSLPTPCSEAIRLLQSPVHCCGDWALLNRQFSHSLLQHPPTWATDFPFIFVVSPADRSHHTLALRAGGVVDF